LGKSGIDLTLLNHKIKIILLKGQKHNPQNSRIITLYVKTRLSRNRIFPIWSIRLLDKLMPVLASLTNISLYEYDKNKLPGGASRTKAAPSDPVSIVPSNKTTAFTNYLFNIKLILAIAGLYPDLLTGRKPAWGGLY
jgi:hypothetical protein